MILEGVLPIPGDADAPSAGLYVETDENSGTGILVRTAGVTEFGSMQADGSGFQERLASRPRSVFQTHRSFSLGA